MHREEAQWIAGEFAPHPVDSISPLLNIGSSTKEFREKHQGFIETLIFSPLRSRGVKVIHQDIKKDEGVDICGDLTDSYFIESLIKLNVRSIICSNLMEHLIDRDAVAQGLVRLFPQGGMIIVTVPYYYPRHMDPIDTMFRPNTDEVAALFPGTRILRSQILDVGTAWNSFVKNPKELLKLLIRLLVPFWRFDGWITALNKFIWLRRPRKITCVVLSVEPISAR